MSKRLTAVHIDRMNTTVLTVVILLISQDEVTIKTQ